MTKVGLAMAVDLAPRTITQYERGAQLPRQETLSRIAATLDFPESFFAQDDLDSPAVEAASFRAVSRMSARSRDQALSFAATAVDFSRWIDERFVIPTLNVPQFSDTAPELAADALRHEWGLSQAPIGHTIDLAERHGVRVFSLPRELADVDAYSFWLDSQPFILLNRSKSTERSRFDIAHELGHLTMHSSSKAHGKQAEQEANDFAAAFMMPEGDVIAYAPPAPTLPALIRLKRRWGVSLPALTRRLFKLNVLSEWQYRALFIDISRRGYRTDEPNSLPPERSQVIDKILHACADMNITPAAIANALSIQVRDLNDMTFGFDLVVDHPIEPPPYVSKRTPNLRVIE